MKHIDLTIQEEAIKRFFLALPADPDGSVVELNGKAVARITPVNEIATDNCREGTAWNGLNVRSAGSVTESQHAADFLKFLNELAARPLKAGPSVGPLNREELYQRGVSGH